MAFEARIRALRIEPHPNADRLELAAVGGYRCVVKKDEFRTGDLAAYIPEGAVCPPAVIADLGLEGRLAGAAKNRVKAVKLRGALSQGLVYPLQEGCIRGRKVAEDDDVTELLGLVKWEPPVPPRMAGEVANANGRTLHYDIENVKQYPDELIEGEEVRLTEKLHGTWCCLGYHPRYAEPIVTSKGLSGRGLVLKHNEQNRRNLYIRTWQRHREAFERVRARTAGKEEPFYLLGEIFGPGVQDLHYGAKEPQFRVFDCWVGEPPQGQPDPGRYLDPDELREAVGEYFALVPEVWRGPFSEAVLLEQTKGATTLDAKHIREGVVIRPARERESPACGRVILKSVSEAYLTRRGGTEYN